LRAKRAKGGGHIEEVGSRNAECEKKDFELRECMVD